MKIRERLAEARVSLSFEFFPPKDALGLERLFESVGRLARYQPTFVSMTYGAGGSTRRSTSELCERLRLEHGLCAMAHLTCSGAAASELAQVAAEFYARGVENVLALRGDPQKGAARFAAAPGGFAHAAELCRFLREHFDFGLAGACYPEKHAEAPSFDADLSRLREKVEAGAEVLITQLFFEPAVYADFVARARAAGIFVPIVPGVLPATDLRALLRMCERCGASVPGSVVRVLAQHEHDPAAMLAVGVELTRALCRALLDAGAPGLHFYTRNRWFEAAAVLDGLDFGQSPRFAPSSTIGTTGRPSGRFEQCCESDP